MESKKYHSLFDLLKSVERMFDRFWDKPKWIKAEIAKLNYYPYSGHCYLQLVEKDQGKTIAEVRSTIWAGNYQNIVNKFSKNIPQGLKDGMEVLILVDVNFTVAHGLSLNIIDIDPSFTIGKMEFERLQCIERLKKENLFDLNRTIVLPSLLKNFAIISVESSKGYQDLTNTLDAFSSEFTIQHKLFPALLQGDKAVDSIRLQLDEIRQAKNQFDAVLIIRGGGGEVGLNCYDNFALASYVAQFPLPIITGIGHASNTTVVEMISNKNLITPTAVANFILSSYQAFKERYLSAQQSVVRNSQQLLKVKRLNLDLLFSSMANSAERVSAQYRYKLSQLHNLLHLKAVELLRHNATEIQKLLERSRSRLGHRFEIENLLLSSIQKQLVNNANLYFNKEKSKLELMSTKVRVLSPENILKKGYSIVRPVDGQYFEKGRGIEITNFDSKISATIVEINKRNHGEEN